MKKTTLIIPVFNGVRYLEQTFKDIDIFVAKHGDFFDKIIFVNDGSTDDTEKRIQEFKNLYSRLPVFILGYQKNKGKGYAIKYALTNGNISSPFVGFTDIELPYGLLKLPLAEEKLNDYDIVVGTRVHDESGDAQHTNYRNFMAKIFRLAMPASISEFKDTQCGFKFFKTNIVQDLFSSVLTHNWIFDIELFLIAKNKKFSVYELPVIINQKCLKHEGGVSLLRHGIHVIVDLNKVYKNIRKHRYE